MTDFGIQLAVEDGIPEFVTVENKKSSMLYDWQRRAINFFFDNNHMALYNVCTGVGKTRMAIEIIKKIIEQDKDCKVLIVVPKNVILETGWYKELFDNGISLAKVGVYYGKTKEYGQITITNMQSLKNVYLEYFNCIILDEAHNYSTDKSLGLLNEQQFKYKIGLTATVERLDQEHWRIMKYFDYHMFKYMPKEALVDSVLNPFDYHNIGVVLDDVARKEYDDVSRGIRHLMQTYGSFTAIMKRGGKAKRIFLGLFTKRKQLVCNYHEKFEVVKEIVFRHKNDKILVFNQFNEQTNKVYWHLLEQGIRAAIIHSNVKDEVVQQRLTDFKNDKNNILLTSKMLDEGYNIPKTDVAILMANDSGDRQIIQRIGRVLRKKAKKSFIYNVYCKDTTEELHVNKRKIFFKGIASDYRDYIWSGKLE